MPVYSKTYVTPRRPFEKARLDQELKLIGQYGLRNKREVWRVKYTLAKIRKAARELLTLEDKSPKRLFEGNALLRRLVRIGVLDESKMKLDYVLGLKVSPLLCVLKSLFIYILFFRLKISLNDVFRRRYSNWD